MDDATLAARQCASQMATFVHNVGCESDQYGFRYDMQSTSRFDPHLEIRQADQRPIPLGRHRVGR